jgi:hypothetical protein
VGAPKSLDFEQRPQIVEAVEQMPDVGRRTVLAMGV